MHTEVCTLVQVHCKCMGAMCVRPGHVRSALLALECMCGLRLFMALQDLRNEPEPIALAVNPMSTLMWP